MLLTRRTWICVALVCLWMGSLYSYFRMDNFLNKGYLLPFDDIARIIETESPGPARLIINAPGMDVSPLTRRMATLMTPRPDVKFIWVLGNRGRRFEPAGARQIRRLDFVPYSRFDRYMMRLLDWDAQPTHVLELTEYAKGPG